MQQYEERVYVKSARVNVAWISGRLVSCVFVCPHLQSSPCRHVPHMRQHTRVTNAGTQRQTRKQVRALNEAVRLAWHELNIEH